MSRQWQAGTSWVSKPSPRKFPKRRAKTVSYGILPPGGKATPGTVAMESGSFKIYSVYTIARGAMSGSLRGPNPNSCPSHQPLRSATSHLTAHPEPTKHSHTSGLCGPGMPSLLIFFIHEMHLTAHTSVRKASLTIFSFSAALGTFYLFYKREGLTPFIMAL